MNENDSWSWHTVDTDATERSSDKAFETLAQCIVDAKEHGYVVWNQAEDRRRSPRQVVE